jgi:RNA polymerase sigma factor (sigma-70 family)
MRGVTTQLIRQLTAAVDHRTDGELLAGFLSRGVEEDFAELVRRHGWMVWSVCRRALPDRADAEDAFQTVFLVLVKKGNKLVGTPTIAPWLHRVAVLTARNLRRRNAHRLGRRATLAEDMPASSFDRDLSIDLDAALLTLPDKFRSSIVLCHLQGFSRADAAAQLGCPEGTLSSWLSRGLARLRAKLGDIDPARMLGITTVAVPAVLSASAVRAAVAFHTTAAISMGLSSAIPQLVEGVIRMLWIKKATAASIALFTMFALGIGVGVSTFQVAPAADGQDKTALTKAGAPTEPSNRLDVVKEEPDIGKILVDLENELLTVREAFMAAKEGVNLAEQKVALGKQQKIDRKDLDNDMETLARYQKEVDASKKKLEVLRKTIITLREYKDQLEKAGALKTNLKQKVPTDNPIQNEVKSKAPPSAPDDIEKKLAVLRRIQTELQIEIKTASLNSRLTESALRTDLQKIGDEIAALEKQKELNPKNPTSTFTATGYFQLIVGTKDAAWPFLIKEFGADGKSIGTTAFENSAVLGRFLARSMKDSTGPKEVRITAQSNMSGEMMASAIEACKAAGVAQPSIKTGDAKEFLLRLQKLDAVQQEKLKNAKDEEDRASIIERLNKLMLETKGKEEEEKLKEKFRRIFEGIDEKDRIVPELKKEKKEEAAKPVRP